MTQSTFLKKVTDRPDTVKKILIIGSIGIGNLLLFSSTLKKIRSFFPNAQIQIIVLKAVFKELYKNDPSVDRIIELDVNKIRSLFERIAFLRKLRKEKYDICLTTFPANRLEYNILAYLSGAKYRISHSYDLKKIKSLSFLQNIKVPVDKSLHDVEQNLALLNPLGVETDQEDNKLYLHTSEQNENEADNFLHENGLNESGIIGIHPGSSAERGMDLKRWPISYFAEIIDWLQSEHKFTILLFGGPEEVALREKIAEKSIASPFIVQNISLLTTAAVIKRCNFFISNDSGLMHVSVAVGTKTIALFGPSDSGRTAPYGENHKVIRLGIDCSPCWSMQNIGVGNVNCIHPENICMTQLSVDKVKAVLSEQLKVAP